MADMITRAAVEADLVAVHAIYADEVLQGTASFELEPPDLELIRERWHASQAVGLPYQVAQMHDEVVAFAYALPYRPRPAYRYTVEHSIYVAPPWRRQGIGARLFGNLIEACTAWGARQMIGIIGDSANAASLRAHEEAGFRQIGILHSVGWKFDRWLDTVIVQRSLGPGGGEPPQVCP
ncbi:MAG: GNAT family N-acetyltransferase [Acidiferrobacteraceae bacterium]|jgi:phosphinothricin acetyltransferase|nr:GNAT family N-acetyltransferase [Acidiferrobacteraceae bacterium]MCP4829789.1 N-acetyltransferase [Pseudomonadota bacterium]HJP06484.1 N-acetyltransferase family protein [Arenicellales bacterium]|tara:strand:- start:8800 stop:9336 length:537 start_codon:yes stop_codon:yes gene_type:complete